MNPLDPVLFQTIAKRLKTDLYLVGGPVRDEILGRPCQDWDFVCRDAKKVARAVSRSLKATFITLDDENQIYRLVAASPQKTILDFAELQGRTIKNDLARRDFTVNAMARLYPDGDVIDPFHGQRDIQKKILRAVSEKSFIDDPLRLLRAFRFQAQLQFSLDRQTQRWVQTHVRRLPKVSAERIREELLRFWKESLITPVLRAMDKGGLLSQIFPEIEACRRTAVRFYGRGGVLKHSLETVENLEWLLGVIEGRKEGGKERSSDRAMDKNLFLSLTPSIIPSLKTYLRTTVGGYPRLAWLKWAAFLHDIGKPATAQVIKGRWRFFQHEHVGADLATRLFQRLRCSRQETQDVGRYVRNHMRLGSLAAAARITPKAISRYFRDLGEDGVGMILISLADHYTYLKPSQRGKGKDPVEKMATTMLNAYYEERAKLLPERLLSGHDLMRAFRLKPGPVIGQLLEKIQDAQAEGKVYTKEDALKFAKRKLR